MVDRGGNFEGWSGSPHAAAAYSGPPSTANNYNSHRQVYMQQLQNFSTNFAHSINGYPPTHYGPLPAHAPLQQQPPGGSGYPHAPPQQQPPLPAHLRSNPYHQNPAQQGAQQHYGGHALRQPQQHYSQYAAPTNYQYPPPYNGYYKRDYPPPPHPPYPPPPHNYYEAPMNLTPKAAHHERTILNTPSYHAANAQQTKPETISVPTCIPIQETFGSTTTAAPPHTMIQPCVSWKRKASTTNNNNNGGGDNFSAPKRQKTEEDIYHFKDEAATKRPQEEKNILLLRDYKENKHNHHHPGGGELILAPPTTVAAPPVLAPLLPAKEVTNPVTSSASSSGTTTSKARKKKESLKQVQQQVLQEQQQIMRIKDVVDATASQQQQQPAVHEPLRLTNHIQHQQQNGLIRKAASPPYPPHTQQPYVQHAISAPPNNTYVPSTYPYGPPPPPPPQPYQQPTYYTPNSPSYPPPPQKSPPPSTSTTAQTTATTSNGNNQPPKDSIIPKTVVSTTTTSNNNNSCSVTTSSHTASTSTSNSSTLLPSAPPKKGGTLWALPIVPKLPQKPLPKERKSQPPPPKKDATSFKDVWLSAFGANKKATPENGASTNNNPVGANNLSSSSSSTTSSSHQSVQQSDPSNSILISQLTAPLPPSSSSNTNIITATGDAGEGDIPKPSSVSNTSVKKAHKTYLDIPPEVRRRPRPNYGGIIHFAPDWEKAVRLHHEKCRLPVKLIKAIHVCPKILNKNNNTSPGGSSSGTASPNSSSEDDKKNPNSISSSLSNNHTLHNFENSNPEDDLSPQRPRSNISSMTSPFSTSADVPRAVNNVVDSILENRKKLRTTMGRMYKKPLAAKDRKRRSNSGGCEDEDGGESEGEASGQCLIPTPGLPLPTSNPSEILMGSNYGNFRRQTLLRYLEMDQFSDLKAKMLDWKPEVFETKTRRQSNQVRAVTAYREIFGIDLPERFTNGKSSSPIKKKKRAYVKKCPSEKDQQQAQVEPKKEVVEETLPVIEIKKEVITEEAVASPLISSSCNSTSTPLPNTNAKGSLAAAATTAKPSLIPSSHTLSSRLQPSSSKVVLPIPSMKARKTPRKGGGHRNDIEDDDDLHEPTQEEEELQAELQKFALELLEDNPSWTDKVVIQNLVIWEPIDPVPYVPEKKPKRYYHRKARKRKSGMDFTSSNRAKNKNSNKSREASRVGTPEPVEVVDIVYTLDQIIGESKGWVIDKGAGETILHRASKMGYPDVVAYALDMVKIPPSIKDNAGIPPIHKAAFRGHGQIVNYLLRYGEDPNTNVKGTRPLHEALEGGDPMAVYHLLTYGSDPLLYDYSGNMPIDLTEGDEEMRSYLSGILADLHGKSSDRWNVSSVKDFVTPNFGDEEDDEEEENASNAVEEFDFDCSGSPLPPYYQFKDIEGHFVKASDLRSSIKGGPPLIESLLKSSFVIEMPIEDFVKNSHCCLLGGPSGSGVVGDISSSSGGIVKLVRVDDNLKKHLGVSSETLSFL